jgi:hypothetical protein
MGSEDMTMEGTEHLSKIARLEEEKSLLWAIIAELESWMFGEGCFISARTNAKLEIARALMAPAEEDLKRYRMRLFLCYQEDQKPKRGRPAKAKTKPDGWSPEARAKHAEECRQRMLAYHANLREQRASEKE